jgi:Xaa-Pro aminopeptidase
MGNGFLSFLNLPISRRLLLRNVLPASISIAMMPSVFEAEVHAQSGANKGDGTMKVSTPSFSVSERNRRWQAVRAVMAKPQWNLDAITNAGSSDRDYCRYLTQIGGRGGTAEFIFPRDGAKPVHALPGSGRNRAFWQKRLSEWTADGKLVLADGEGSEKMSLLFKNLGLDKPGTRIGVVKLSASRFEPEGLVSVSYLEKLKGAFPGMSFLPIEKWGPDSGPIDEPAMVKSAEEHEAIRASVAAGEKAIETIRQVARPPAKTQADIWFPTFTAMFAETGEDPIRLSISLDEPSNSTLGAPVGDPLQPGQIISQEIDASVQGHRAQVNHSIFVGGSQTPGFNYYKAAMEVAIKVLHDSAVSVVPGKTTCGQLVDHYVALVEKANAEDRSGVVLHSSGISNLSRPRLGPSNSRGEEAIVIVPGMTFDFKPALRLKKEVLADVKTSNRVVQIGEHYLITERGAVRMGKRDLKPLATEA